MKQMLPYLAAALLALFSIASGLFFVTRTKRMPHRLTSSSWLLAAIVTSILGLLSASWWLLETYPMSAVEVLVISAFSFVGYKLCTRTGSANASILKYALIIGVFGFFTVFFGQYFIYENIWTPDLYRRMVYRHRDELVVMTLMLESFVIVAVLGVLFIRKRTERVA